MDILCCCIFSEAILARSFLFSHRLLSLCPFWCKSLEGIPILHLTLADLEELALLHTRGEEKLLDKDGSPNGRKEIGLLISELCMKSHLINFKYFYYVASTLRRRGVYDPSCISLASNCFFIWIWRCGCFPLYSERWRSGKYIRTGINGNDLISLFLRQWIISSLLMIYVNLNTRQTANYCMLQSLPQQCCHIWKHIITHMSSFKLNLNFYCQSMAI